MKTVYRLLALLLALISVARADEPREVTIIGGWQRNGMCTAKPKPDDHVMVIFAVDGSPEIAARVKKVMDEFYPEQGLDAAAAAKLQAAFEQELKFFIAPESTAEIPNAGTGARHYDSAAQPVALTGTIYDRDGRHWIKVAKIEKVKLKYPEKMLAADRPFVTPAKERLMLKVSDSLSLECIKIPAGQAMLGAHFFMARRYQEEFPRLVTLTKPYYLAEIPITQEMWEAVMAGNPSTLKDPHVPVQNPLFPDVDKFCQLLSQKTGRKVRLPTAAEWEYAARCGTSNPGFPEKYLEQNSAGQEGWKAVLPVKSKKPNAWGLYDMVSCWWEITADKAMYPERHDETDPSYPAGTGHEKRCTMGVPTIDAGWSLSMREFQSEHSYASNKFRVLVEVE